MADLTVSEIRARYPEFGQAEYPDAIVETTIANAYRLTDISKAATLACTAHLLALTAEETSEIDGGSGELKSETTGPVQAAYMVQAFNAREVFFTRTAYGRDLLAIESRTAKGVMSSVFA